MEKKAQKGRKSGDRKRKATSSATQSDVNDESLPKRKKNTRSQKKLAESSLSISDLTSIEAVKTNKRNVRSSGRASTAESQLGIYETILHPSTLKIDGTIFNKRGKSKNIKSNVDLVERIVTNEENLIPSICNDLIPNSSYDEKLIEKSGTIFKKRVKSKNIKCNVDMVEKLKVTNEENVIPSVCSDLIPNSSNDEKLIKKTEISNKLRKRQTEDSSKLLNTKSKKKFYGLVTDSMTQNLKRKMQVKKVKQRKNELVKIHMDQAYNQTVLNTDINEKRSATLSSSSSSCSCTNSPQKLDSIYSFSPPEIINSNTYSKVSTLNHIKPFNISVNVDNKNHGRTVEFVKPISCTVTSFTQSNLTHAASDENISDITSFSDITNAVLQFYSGGWLYDFTEEELTQVTSRDFLFTNSKVMITVDSELTLNDNKKILETQSDNLSHKSSLESLSTKSNFQFLKPILPPVKRPPTRIKTNQSSTSTTINGTSVGSLTDKTSTTSKNSNSNLSSPVPDDDVLSIYSTWSINTSDFPVTHNLLDKKRQDEAVKQENLTPSSSIRIPREEVRHLPQSSQYKDIIQWVENSQQQLQLQDRKNFHDFSVIPNIFKQYCYYAFTNGVCHKKNCKRIHTLGRNRKIYLENLNMTQLIEAYEFAKGRVALFLPLLNNFISEFAKFGCSHELMSMVEDVMIPENTRKALDVKNIISALKTTGYTFVKCIEEILFTHGQKNIKLTDVLLSAVIDEVKNLNSNWYLVQKILQYRNFDLINHSLIENVLKVCYGQQNIELSVKVVNDIFKWNLVNLSLFNEFILNNFVSFLQHKNAIEEINVVLEAAKLNNITLKVYTNHTLQHPQSSTNCAHDNYPPNFVNDSHTSDIMRFSPPPPSICSGNDFHLNEVPELQPEVNIGNRLQYVVNNISPIIGNTNNINGDLTQIDLCDDSTSSEYISMSGEDEVQVYNNSSNQNCDPYISPGNRECDRLEANLPDGEVKKLSEIISQQQHVELIAIYNNYKNTSFNYSFVLNVISLFKKKDTTSIYELVKNLIEGLEEQNSHFTYLSNAESTLYLLALNAIVLLKQMRSFREAAMLLFKFFNCLDNLTKVQWMRSMHKHSLSDVGKYLYFCQIFTRGGYFNATLEILKSKDLNLLYSFNKWSLPYIESFDNEFRNDVVQEFICVTLREDLKLAKDIILYMVTSKDSVTEVHVWKYFDDLILAMLNNNIVEDITQMLPKILQGWYKYLKKNNMRGLLVQLVTAKISDKQLITLYSKCCKRNIYQKLKGNETSIILRTDMTIEEIFITIRYFLHKLLKNNFEIQQVMFLIRMPDVLNNQPKILLNSECGMTQTKDRILVVLTRCFPTAIIVHNCDEYNIVVKPDQLKLCVDYYRKCDSESKCIWVRQSAVEQLCAI